jgi:hypothetical protein
LYSILSDGSADATPVKDLENKPPPHGSLGDKRSILPLWRKVGERSWSEPCFGPQRRLLICISICEELKLEVSYIRGIACFVLFLLDDLSRGVNRPIQ